MSRTSILRPALLLPLLWAAAPSRALAEVGISLNPEVEILTLNIVVVILLIYPVNRLLIRPLVHLLEERERRSAGASLRTDQLRQETSDLRSALTERLAQARASAQARRAEILARGQEEERSTLEEARRDALQQVESVRGTIAQESGEARSALEGEARTLAREAAARILGRAL